jgi:hypothetical protein
VIRSCTAAPPPRQMMIGCVHVSYSGLFTPVASIECLESAYNLVFQVWRLQAEHSSFRMSGTRRQSDMVTILHPAGTQQTSKPRPRVAMTMMTRRTTRIFLVRLLASPLCATPDFQRITHCYSGVPARSSWLVYILVFWLHG